jgi:hypothetical protein
MTGLDEQGFLTFFIFCCVQQLVGDAQHIGLMDLAERVTERTRTVL